MKLKKKQNKNSCIEILAPLLTRANLRQMTQRAIFLLLNYLNSSEDRVRKSYETCASLWSKTKTKTKTKRCLPFCSNCSNSQDPTRPISVKGVATEDNVFSFISLLNFTRDSKVKWRILLCSFSCRFLTSIYCSMKTGLFEVLGVH